MSGSRIVAIDFDRGEWVRGEVVLPITAQPVEGVEGRMGCLRCVFGLYPAAKSEPKPRPSFRDPAVISSPSCPSLTHPCIHHHLNHNCLVAWRPTVFLCQWIPSCVSALSITMAQSLTEQHVVVDGGATSSSCHDAMLQFSMIAQFRRR